MSGIKVYMKQPLLYKKAGRCNQGTGAFPEPSFFSGEFRCTTENDRDKIPTVTQSVPARFENFGAGDWPKLCTELSRRRRPRTFSPAAFSNRIVKAFERMTSEVGK